MSRCDLTPLPWLGVLAVSGSERAEWLHAMITQDVLTMSPLEVRYACAVNLKGKVLADFQLANDSDRLLLEMDRERIAPLIAHLDARIITEDVELSDLSEDLHVLTVQGPDAARLLDLKEPGSLAQVTLGGRPALVVPRSHTGAPGFDLLVAPTDAAIISAALHDAGAVAMAAQDLDAARIRAAIPRYGLDMDDTVFPLEAGLTDAIHWSKGCYLGQEVIARMAHRGHTNKELRLLRVDGPPPAPGSLLWPGDPEATKSVGRITSAAASEGGSLALGYVRRKHFAPGTRLLVQSKTGDAAGRSPAEVMDTRVRAHVPIRPEMIP